MKNLFKITFLPLFSLFAFTSSSMLYGQNAISLQADIDAIETGAGLEANGSYAADATTNYLTGATSLKDADKQLDAQLKTESDARSTADTALGTRITDETTARTDADTALGTRITDETKARTDADTALGTQITDETTARTTADTNLNTKIDTESSTRATADTALGTRITDETKARTDADTALGTQITAETKARTDADTLIQKNINLESSNRATADTNINTRITAETTARTDADTAIKAGAGLGANGTYTKYTTSNYINGATSLHNADDLLDKAIKAESDARIQGDALLRGDINRNTLDIQRNREGIAMVAAMTHTTLLPGKETALDIGIANFETETAYSINFARRVKEGVQVNLSAASTSGINGAVVRGSIGFQW